MYSTLILAFSLREKGHGQIQNIGLGVITHFQAHIPSTNYAISPQFDAHLTSTFRVTSRSMAAGISSNTRLFRASISS